MSLQEAALWMGFTRRVAGKRFHAKKAAENLRKQMNAGFYPFEQLSRKQFIFSRDDFPEESWPHILPRH
jgi:hypothetical protein